MRRTETPKPIFTKFSAVVEIPDLVNYTNFGHHRLRGFGWRGLKFPPSPIDFHRRPYNTLALPCECVMDVDLFFFTQPNPTRQLMDPTQTAYDSNTRTQPNPPITHLCEMQTSAL